MKSMCKLSVLCMAISALVLFSINVLGGGITPVNCTGNPSDRALIQTAINYAGTNATLKLVGTCQLDGTPIYLTKSNLTITGTGSAGAWSSVVKGLANPNGSPVGIPPSGQFFNIAFTFDSSGNSHVSNISIQNLKFSTLHGVFDVAPQLGGLGRNCSGEFSESIGTGTVKNVVFQNNWLDNNGDGVFIVGNSENLLIQNNKITKNRGTSILIQGQGFFCVEAGQFLPLFPFGMPKNVAVIGNTISQDLSSFPVFITGADSVLVNNNAISTNTAFSLAALVIGETKNSLIANNQIDATGTFLGGIYASDWAAATPGFPPNSSKNLITTNKICNASAGTVVDTSTTGFSIVGQKISGSSVADIYLCGAVTDPSNFICEGAGNPTGPSIPSFNNSVVALPGTTVRNDGTNNSVIGGVTP